MRPCHASFAVLMGLCTLCCLGSLCPAAEPATKPAKPRSDERQIIDKTYGFSFNVPKLWKQIEQKGDRAVYVFQLPAPAGMAKAASSWIVLAEPGKASDTVEQFADRMRGTILKRTKDAKIESDKAIQLLGVDAWEIVYTMKMQVKVITQTGKDKSEQTEDVATRVRCTLFLHGDAAYQFILTADEAGFDNRMKAADRMLSTFQLGPATNEANGKG